MIKLRTNGQRRFGRRSGFKLDTLTKIKVSEFAPGEDVDVVVDVYITANVADACCVGVCLGII